MSKPMIERWPSKADAEAWARDTLLYGSGSYRVEDGVRYYVSPEDVWLAACNTRTQENQHD